MQTEEDKLMWSEVPVDVVAKVNEAIDDWITKYHHYPTYIVVNMYTLSQLMPLTETYVREDDGRRELFFRGIHVELVPYERVFSKDVPYIQCHD